MSFPLHPNFHAKVITTQTTGVWEAMQRCQVVTARLNQEIRDFHELAQDSDSENEN